MSAQEPTLFTEPVDTEKPSPENEGLDSRAAALGLLGQILGRKTPLDQALENNSAFKILPGRDKAFCRMMLSTVLRRLGQLDDLIARAEEKPDTEHPPVIRDILRLGAAQILFMNVPDHAAVDTSVRLAAAARMDRRKGFVNGVLRTITRKGREWMARQDEGRLNTPEWLLKSWIADYGLRTAAEIARAHTAEAPLDITVRDESQRSYWAAAFKATQMGTGTLRLVKGGIVTDMDGFREGHWWVQDASAALPALLFGDIKGRSVVDL
ncbi:MAG: MFS transporter, partial [Alphaproteobacteria bacterium]|nr:MFS transporter [Alphaproteobacteria bacterium]